MHFNFPGNSNNNSSVKSSSTFISINTVVFMVAVFATVFYSQSMGDEMVMPGAWKMSMMWMGMPDETWMSSTISFLLMWLAMMIAMMMPSALPAFLKTKQRWQPMCYTASGYFAVWLLAGFVTYLLGMMINSVAMQSASFSAIIPLLSGVILVIAAAIQFTQWKMTHLMRCRTVINCLTMPGTANRTGFSLGLQARLSLLYLLFCINDYSIDSWDHEPFSDGCSGYCNYC